MCHHFYLYKSIFLVRGAWPRGASTHGTPPPPLAPPLAERPIKKPRIFAATERKKNHAGRNVSLISERSRISAEKEMLVVSRRVEYCRRLAPVILVVQLTPPGASHVHEHRVPHNTILALAETIIDCYFRSGCGN